MSRRVRFRLFAWAIGGSIALHVILAYTTHGYKVVRAHDAPRVGHLTLELRPSPPPTPRPTPPPRVVVPQHARTVAHRSIIRPRAIAVRASHKTPARHAQPNAIAIGAVTVPGAALPAQPIGVVIASPVVAPTPSCAQPNVAAHVLTTAPADAPADMTNMLASAAEIAVQLDASGRVRSAKVYRSAGAFTLDRVALGAARASTYAPQVRGCTPVSGTYLFVVDFQG